MKEWLLERCFYEQKKHLIALLGLLLDTLTFSSNIDSLKYVFILLRTYTQLFMWFGTEDLMFPSKTSSAGLQVAAALNIQ